MLEEIDPTIMIEEDLEEEEHSEVEVDTIIGVVQGHSEEDIEDLMVVIEVKQKNKADKVEDRLQEKVPEIIEEIIE